MFWNKKELKIEDKLGDLVGAWYCIAVSDGRVDDTERKLMSERVRELTHGAATVSEIERLLGEAVARVEKDGKDKFLRSIGRALDQEGRVHVLRAAAATITADGELSEPETATYAQLAENLGFKVEFAEEILDEVIEQSRK
jgi:tellurite resistance protein